MKSNSRLIFRKSQVNRRQIAKNIFILLLSKRRKSGMTMSWNVGSFRTVLSWERVRNRFIILIFLHWQFVMLTNYVCHEMTAGASGSAILNHW